MYLLRRSLIAVSSLWVATTAAFIALRFIPGDTLTILAAERSMEPAVVEAWRHQYGLDKPILVQYAIYLGNLIRADFGFSYYTGQSVTELLAPALLNTIRWQIPALLGAIATALAIAAVTAPVRGRLTNGVIGLLMLIGISLPEFAIAAVLVSVFSVRLGLLPVAGIATPAHFILPALTMGIFQCAAFCRILRSEISDVTAEDYVRAAVARGVPRWRVVLYHVLPNALGPFLTLAGIQIGRAIGGAFLIETLYNIPGLGRLAVLAVIQRDYPIVLAVTILMTLGFIASSLIVDLLYQVVDKRTSVAG